MGGMVKRFVVFRSQIVLEDFFLAGTAIMWDTQSKDSRGRRSTWADPQERIDMMLDHHVMTGAAYDVDPKQIDLWNILR